jgi:hypothetical protein
LTLKTFLLRRLPKSLKNSLPKKKELEAKDSIDEISNVEF